MTRRYGRARRGVRVSESTPEGNWKILIILGAMSVQGLIATMTIEAATDAEIFLAYNVATSSTLESPRLIMLDQSLSGIMAAVSHGANTELAGYQHDRRALDEADILIACAIRALVAPDADQKTGAIS